MSTNAATTVTVTHGETRRLVHLVARKSAIGFALTVVLQNVITVPGWLSFTAPVAHVLRLSVGA